MALNIPQSSVRITDRVVEPVWYRFFNDLNRAITRHDLTDFAVVSSDPRFGIVGDGVADDTVGLQAFLTEFETGDYGIAVLKEGVYNYTPPLTLTVPGSSTFRRKAMLCYGAQLRPDTSVAAAAFEVTGSGFDGFDLVGLSVYQYRNSATGFANTAGIVVKRGYQVYVDNCIVLAGDNSGAAITGYDGIVFKHSDKDTGGLHCKLTNCHVLGTPNKIHASLRVEGVQNGLSVEHNAFVSAQTGVYITHPPEASSGGDTYYGYIINGIDISGSNLFESLDKGIEVVGRSGVAKSRFGMATIHDNRVESVTTWIDMTGTDVQPTDRPPPQAYSNMLQLVTNQIVNPNNIEFWGIPQAFTPTLLFGGAATGMTGSFTGEWCRKDDVITGSLKIVLTAKGSSAGTATVRAMPYNASFDMAFPLWASSLTSGVGDTMLMTLMASGGKIIALYDISGGDAINLTEADFEDTTSLRISFSYTV